MSEGFDSQLIRGSLELMVLSVLADGRQYGYSIQQRLRDSTGSRLNLQAGTLYPLLHRLEAEKLIRANWDDSTGRRRKWYEITVQGRKSLKQQASEWRAYTQCVQNLLPRALQLPFEPA